MDGKHHTHTQSSTMCSHSEQSFMMLFIDHSNALSF